MREKNRDQKIIPTSSKTKQNTLPSAIPQKSCVIRSPMPNHTAINKRPEHKMIKFMNQNSIIFLHAKQT
jgi:hypothetical protein